MSNRVEGERVFCYQCENEWDRAHGGLQCPRCQSEFVEIVGAQEHANGPSDISQLSPGARPEPDDPPEVTPDEMDLNRDMRPIREHYPFNAPDPDEDDISNVHTFSFGGNRSGHSTFTFQRTYTTGFGGPRQNQTFRNGGDDPVANEIMRDFQQMVGGMLGGRSGMNIGGSYNINGRAGTFGNMGGIRHDEAFPGPMMSGPPDFFSMLFPGSPAQTQGQRGGPQPMAGPFGGLLGMLLDPANARSGDAVFSQEALDRVMSQLMEQHQQNGAPPASEDLINQLPRKPVDKTMLGDDEKAECSICMDNVEMGAEVTVLPCKHWFHFECVQSWLKEHDTCPHCRKPITPENQQNQPARPDHGRRSSRRSSSVATPWTQMPGSMPSGGSRDAPIETPDSPSRIRAARESYYGRQRTESDRERASSERRSSRRSNDDGGGGGSGIGNWWRSRFSSSQSS